MIGSEKGGAHRWSAKLSGMMHQGGWRSGAPMTRPREKEVRGHGEQLCGRNQRIAVQCDG
jgi:hypothetical protein